MATALFILIILSGMHFIYDAILLPSIRLDLRYRMFTLRDRLVNLKAEHGNDISDDVFEELYANVNTSIRCLPFINVSLIVETKRQFEANANLRQVVEAKINRMENCRIEEVREISRKSTSVFGLALLSNMGMWLLYLLPIILLVGMLIFLLNQVSYMKVWLRKSAFAISYIFEKVKTHPETSFAGQYC